MEAWMKIAYRLHVGGNRLLVALMLGLTVYLLSTSVEADQRAVDTALVDRLRQGGLVIYFRHEATNWSLQDNMGPGTGPDDWFSCSPSKMRQLSDQGREHARQTGKAMRALGVPVSRVFASPYCRTVETAELFDLGPVTPTADVMNLRVAEHYGGTPAIVQRARALLATVPGPSSNHVVVAHGNVAQAATPVYPGEGEGVIFEPDGGGSFSVLGRLSPAQWRLLARQWDR
jgi:broad specificity phosphatase PhoE